jgi:hypothetical protein
MMKPQNVCVVMVATLIFLASLGTAVPVAAAPATAPEAQVIGDCTAAGEGATTEVLGITFVCRRQLNGSLQWEDVSDCYNYFVIFGSGVTATGNDGVKYVCRHIPGTLMWHWEVAPTVDPFSCSDYAEKYGVGVTAQSGGVTYSCQWSNDPSHWGYRWVKTQ